MLARAVASNAFAELTAAGGSFHEFELDETHFNATAHDSCCDEVTAVLHPELGAFFRMRLPAKRRGGAAAAEPSSTTYRLSCFRRAWSTDGLLVTGLSATHSSHAAPLVTFVLPHDLSAPSSDPDAIARLSAEARSAGGALVVAP